MSRKSQELWRGCGDMPAAPRLALSRFTEKAVGARVAAASGAAAAAAAAGHNVVIRCSSAAAALSPRTPRHASRPRAAALRAQCSSVPRRMPRSARRQKSDRLDCLLFAVDPVSNNASSESQQGQREIAHSRRWVEAGSGSQQKITTHIGLVGVGPNTLLH